MNKNTLAAMLATTAVVAVLILGFRFLGSPASQRLVREDRQDVWALSMLAQELNGSWTGPSHILPEDLDKIRATTTKRTSVSSKPFVYHRKDESHYELCSTFATDNRKDRARNTPDFWLHPKGDYCFSFDAAESVAQAPYVY